MKVAIIGGRAQQKHFTPQDDVEIWGINANRFDWIPRWNRMFNLHFFQRLKDYGWPVEREAEWAAINREIPFYVCDPWPEGWLPAQHIFPREELAKMRRGNYHCGSADWLVAFAIYSGATEIHIHGVGLCLDPSEPISARACLEYWCGYAEGLGIKIVVAEDCDFFHFYHLVKSTLVYGYDDTPIYEDRTKEGVPYSFNGK